jgi:hypothetical protein
MTSTSVHQKFSGLLIVIGSLVFVCGGAFHPRINSSLGALGSTEFFQNFYMHIAHHGSWRLIHGMILAGPVLWLLGIGSLWSGRSGWTRMATTAMTLAATAWAVTFVFDGFVAPDIVRWLTPETGWHVLAVNQDVVIRLGLVSWLMLGFAMITGSVGILVSNRSGSARMLAWLGISLGAWPFIAWATGIFLPGPFTSPYWNATAVSTAFWFLVVGVFLLVSAPPQNGVEPVGEPPTTSRA